MSNTADDSQGRRCNLADPARLAFAVALLALNACTTLGPPAGADVRGNGIAPPRPPQPESHRIVVLPTARGMVDWAAPGDFDGDGRADFGVKHDTGHWTWDRSVDGFESSLWQRTVRGYGGPAAMPVPADYDGDLKTDRAIYGLCGDKEASCWCITFSTAGDGFPCFALLDSYAHAQPVPADYDGDGG